MNKKIWKHTRKSKKDIISEKVLECCRDTGKLHDLINNITGTTKENPLPDHTNEKALANEFGEFFLDKIQKIQRQLDDKLKHQPLRTAPAEASLNRIQSVIRGQSSQDHYENENKAMHTRHHTNTNH